DEEVKAAHAPAPARPEKVYGRIMVEENGKEVPLPGVNLYWLSQQDATVTDEEGRFTLERPSGSDQLVASYIGYYSDTITIKNETNVELTLTQGATLDEVEVTYQRKSIEVSFLEPILTQNISSKELLKAACCTLAESFETNPAVDVSFTDAVTGARQIEMLGLAGPYVQIARENIPDVRGLSSIYGLTYIPGPWIESIQLAKGPGSVTNGFESITGQINVELKKPEESERFYLNLYGNGGSRLETNMNTRVQLNNKWSTGILLHGNWLPAQNDRNEDGFLDMPTGTEWTAVNRWKYQGDNGWNSQFGIKVTNFDKISGQLDFDKDQQQSNIWGAQMRTRRLEGWAKTGIVFPNRPEASVGLQLSASLHDQDASFGNTRYDANQESFYANLIYREQLGNPAHQLNSGLSLQVDQYDEWLDDVNYQRNESVYGAFAEYVYQPGEHFTGMLGLRGDYHNQFGFFVTPRLHLRYAPVESTVLRLAAGQGRRTASIIAENIGMLASSRRIILENDNSDTPYGLQQEIAWNMGVSLRQTFQIDQRELVLTLDAYHTRFDQQIVVDYDQSPQEVRFYNLDGQSYSNTFQAQVDYALVRNFDVRMAYRFNDVRTDFSQGRLERPFVARHRAFINLAYETDDQWAFDLTVNWQGAKRIPSTASNPEIYQRPERSPDFVVTNVQVSKTWWEKFDVYVGVENLFDFQQANPIIAADDPFGDNFDSSLVWGPIFGRMAYAGIRYTIE
ncbi:MAG: TonB-dependent receptor, partial [Saprospiraceae bacterium]|nr:TonB-dependent receptor [Saprospiraceae bacterium]